MSTTQRLSVTLPNDLADAVKANVEAGIYASESDVIRGGLRALIARGHTMENWLRNQVGSAFDALNLNPSSAFPHQLQIANHNCLPCNCQSSIHYWYFLWRPRLRNYLSG